MVKKIKSINLSLFLVASGSGSVVFCKNGVHIIGAGEKTELLVSINQWLSGKLI